MDSSLIILLIQIVIAALQAALVYLQNRTLSDMRVLAERLSDTT